MLTITADLKKQIEAGDEAKIKTTAPQLEEVWKTFEDEVKAKYPDDYANIEKNGLNSLVAGSKANPLDKPTLAKLNDQLTQALNAVQTKLKSNRQ